MVHSNIRTEGKSLLLKNWHTEILYCFDKYFEDFFLTTRLVRLFFLFIFGQTHYFRYIFKLF